MEYLAVTVIILACLAAGVFLILHGHVWTGAFCLLCAAGVRTGKDSE